MYTIDLCHAALGARLIMAEIYKAMKFNFELLARHFDG